MANRPREVVLHSDRPNLDVLDGNADAPTECEIALGLPQFASMLPDGSATFDASGEVWSRQLDPVVAAGFTSIEIPSTWLPVAELSATRRTELFDVIAARGLTVLALGVTRASVLDPGFEEKNLAIHHRTIDVAAEAGIRFVSMGLHSPLLPPQLDALWFWDELGAQHAADPERYPEAVAKFQELGNHAAEVGVVLSLEMYEDTFLGAADSAVGLVEDIGLDSVGLNPDIGNLLRLNRPVDTWEYMIHRTAPVTNYWHVKNYSRSRGPEAGTFVTSPASLETGIINYRKALPYLFSQGFTGPFVVEHYGGDGIGICTSNREYLRSLIS